MDWINYHHLLYFWTIAKEGGISKAADTLHLSQPTLSSQLKKLEKSMGLQLFDRVGRSLVLTDSGQMVFRYADEIFSIGKELAESIKGNPASGQLRLTVGVPDALPKLIVYRLLKPALQLPEKVQLQCFEAKLDDLLSDLALHRLDLVLADTPLPPHVHVKAFNHLLGECGISIFGTTTLVKKYKKQFPISLHLAPMLLPTQNTTLRRALEQWFDKIEIRPNVLHEFEDSGILKVFGQAGEGLFAAPSAIENEICQQYGVKIVGRIPDVTEKFYAISVERRLKHPAVLAISRAAKDHLFVSDEFPK